MADPITKQELEDATLDVEVLNIILNAPADRPNPGHPNGTVTTRLGVTFPVMAKLLESGS